LLKPVQDFLVFVLSNKFCWIFDAEDEVGPAPCKDDKQKR